MSEIKYKSSEKFIKKIINYCNEKELINYGDRILCGVSGGADSVCMLKVLYNLRDYFNLDLFVAHLEHGIRGKESLEDQEFVKRLCNSMKIDLYTENIDVKSLKKGGQSIEEVARTIRMKFLFRAMHYFGADKIAIAHNLDDLIETVLYRMIRGTGPIGFIGIKPKTKYIIRPLLGIKREEIIEFLKKENIEYRNDSTNFNLRYSRNRIRHCIIPEIKKIDVRYREHIVNLLNTLQEYNDFIDGNLDKIIEDLLKEKSEEYVKIKYDMFFNLHPALKKRLILYFVDILTNEDEKVYKRIYIPYSILQNITNIKYTGNKCLYKNKRITILKEYDLLIIQKSVVEENNREYLYIADNMEEDIFIKELGKRVVFKLIKGVVNFEKDKLYFDADKVKLPIIIRNRRIGDSIRLYKVGVKKLKDIFIDDKVSPRIRSHVPVVAINGKIAGIFCSFYGKTNKVSEDFKVTDKTENVLVSFLY